MERRSWSPNSQRAMRRKSGGGKWKKELKNLQSDVIYDREERGINRRKGRRGRHSFESQDEDKFTLLEY